MKLSFHGGAREVTGACYLLETKKTKILIDCGLFQGCEECADLNFENFKFNPEEIEALFITHAHLDHVGRIPKLVHEGFKGIIYSTPPTRDLARLILEDALSISLRQNHALYSKPSPLTVEHYTQRQSNVEGNLAPRAQDISKELGKEDLEKTFTLWQDAPYGREIVAGDMRFVFREAGHILGSAFIDITAEDKHLLFTGDLGNVPSPLLPPPEIFHNIEYLIIESTYGNRQHEKEEERRLRLERAIEDIAARRGVLIIPAFATERTQDILFSLNEMLFFKRIPEMPVFVDAPLAIRATTVFEKYPQYYRDEIKEIFWEHPNLFKFKKLRFTETVEESKHINDVSPPKVVIAGSGMMQGGRILHHLRRYLSDEKNILLITGYQAAGSLGRRLIDGVKIVKLFGEEIPVRAEIRKINGFSAHADNLQLFNFVSSNKDTLKRVFVVQGEEAAALHFMQEVKDRLGVEAVTPMLYDECEI